MVNTLFLCFSTLTLVFLFGCNPQPQGEQLAKQYCGSCHAFPDPSLLDKATWKESVLPEMAFRMGLNSERLFKIPYQDLDAVLTTLPASPLVTEEEYKLIEAYFIKNAPDSLATPEKYQRGAIAQFSFISKSLPFYDKPFVTALTIDTAGKRIYMGDRFSVLYQLDLNFNLKEYTQLKSPPSKILIENDTTILVSLIGNMSPNEQKGGALVEINTKFTQGTGLIDSLQRPSHFEKADFNGDRVDDVVVCAFGNYTGGLLVYERRGAKFIKHIISSTPGARRVVLKDVDEDGLQDILVLMTQGNERISLFLNKGNFTFEEKVLLQFPPVYGSSYFDIADFNNDGQFDILYTNGDNADYSLILKPYHSVKIFLNSGDLKFKEYWSYPMYGASQALARDFDKDGDLDIAAISFFPDFENSPEESFMYFENQGDNSFVSQLSKKATVGRWMVMEAGDYDQDGDCDIFLGAHNLQMKEHLEVEGDNNPVAILVLKNNLK